MRYRRFGSSDLVVSEVGFGTWTLVTDWWGRTDHPHDMITAALDAGINFIDTAPVYGTEGAGETILAPYLTVRDDIVHHDEVRLRHHRRAQVPRPVGTPARLAARVDPPAVRRLAAPARHRPHRSATSCTTRASSRSSPTTSGTTLLALQARGQGARARRRARPRDRLGRGRQPLDRRPADRVAADRVQHARAGAGPHVRAAPARRSTARSSLIVARAARLRHALGQGHARHRVPEGRPPRAPQPRQHARQLREGRDARRSCGRRDRSHDRAGRDRRRSSPTRRSRACCRPCSRSTTCASTRPRPTSRSPPTSTSEVDELWARNFDHVDRYVMPLKSSV